MSSLHGAEIDWIVALQNVAELQGILRFLVHVGHSSVPYLAPLIYLCISRRIGGLLYLLTALNSCLVWVLKSALHLPRPFWLDPRVRVFDRAAYYGMPSGHVQAATCVWFFLAQAVRSFWAWSAASLLVLIVAFSRVYFGVHFISDVVGGFLVGAALLWVFLWTDGRFRGWLAKLGLGRQFGAAALATAALMAVAFLAASLCPSPEIDPAGSSFHVDLRRVAGFMGPSGRLFGTACALAAANRWARFSVAGPLWECGIRCAFVFSGLELSSTLWGALPVPQGALARSFFLFWRSAWTPLWVLFFAPLVLMGAALLRKSEEMENRIQTPTVLCHN
jgi:membrane-associated phospholipid phosphatase